MKKWGNLYSIPEKANWYSHRGNQYRGSSKQSVGPFVTLKLEVQSEFKATFKGSKLSMSKKHLPGIIH